MKNTLDAIVQSIQPMMRTLSVSFAVLLPIAAAAQEVTFGVVGGVPAQPPLGRSAERLPFVIGPTLSVGFGGPITLESGVLFHRIGRTSEFAAFPGSGGAVQFFGYQWDARAIEIPLMLRYRFLDRMSTWRPFVSAGGAVRRTEIDFRGSPANTETVKWNLDPAAGVGVSFRSGRVTIEPEVRYSYWGAGKHQVVRQNQVFFLFGLRF